MVAITWLADVLRAAGVQVVEEGNWQSRTAGGTFNPIGVLWHHTNGPASSPSNPAPSLSVCINGRTGLPGPLCHAMVDYNGVFHVISANHANHAGDARQSGPIPAGSGNTMLIGWEIDYVGDDPVRPDQAMSAAQYDASIKATAAVLKRLGRDASYARGHRETSVTGKIDPSFVDLDAMRADVARRMQGGADRPVIGDWSGEGVADVGVYRPSESRFHLRRPDTTTFHLAWGAPGDIPVTGDWTGDRVADVGIYRPSESRFHLRLPNGQPSHFPWGAPGDIPVTGDWTGDGVCDLGIYRPSESRFHLRLPNGQPTYFAWGAPGDIPVTGDWTGDGVCDLGIYRPSESRYHLRLPNGQPRYISYGIGQ